MLHHNNNLFPFKNLRGFSFPGVAGILMLWALAVLPPGSLAQVDDGKPAKMSVGMVAAPPFAMKTGGGAWEGLSIDIWQAIVDDRIDAFVFDETVLKYNAKNDFTGRVHVLAETYDQYYIYMGFPIGSPLRKPINGALLKTMETDCWNRLVTRYIGSGGWIR